MALAAFSVQAQDNDEKSAGGQWRISAGAAFGDFKTDDKVFDDSQVGFQFTAGYKFNRWFGIEGGYLNTTDYETVVPSGVFGGQFASGGLAEISFSGFNISVVGYIPTPSEEIDFFGKLGFYDYNTDLVFNGETESSANTDGGLVGVGAVVSIAEQWGIRAEFDWYDLDDAELWAVVLGAEYRF